ncbi:MAG: hypothetical protein KKG09_01710 [Verrucomicrobia bacterium]|nr:hypothetical protein [Verrucomicrobiota bacterium]MBU4292392.1 hypothetical protein [Verrucomicrobiota bacterium]MBU4429076.1 hypothetical protein [Verrucomicrobiota bacterium]MBU4496710.1 hypothetical protein [Verrucomicrobiota bacterium]
MKNSLFFSVMLGLFLVNLPGTAQTNSPIPFLDTFESYPEGTALVAGTNGWYGSETNITVQTNIFSPYIAGTNSVGTQSVQIPIDCTLSNQFTNNTHTSIWFQIDMRLALYNGENLPEVNTNAAIYFYINSNGYAVIHDGPASPATNWIVMDKVITGENAEQMNETNWARINIHQDFTTKTWDLFVNYILITNNIRFVNTNLSSLNSLGCYNGNSTTTFMDNVWTMTTNPPDMSQHGSNWLPNITGDTSSFTCAIMGGSTHSATQTYNIWKTGYYDMWFTNTISGLTGPQSWLSLMPATGTSTGNPGSYQQMTVT